MFEVLSWLFLFLIGLSIYNISQTSQYDYLNEECKTINGAIGTCTLPINCIVVDLIQHPKSLEAGRKCPISYICCLTTSTINTSLLPNDCGISLMNVKDRITNGNESNLFEFPWQVTLKYITSAKTPFLCGGTVISNRYILTAAHCIRTKSKLVAVRLGEYDFRSNPDCIIWNEKKICAPEYNEINITSKNAVVHNKFNSGTLENDIALIRLPKEIIFNENIAPICLPIKKYIKKNLDRLIVTGWGNTENNDVSQVLMKVSIPLVQGNKCKLVYRNQVDISETQLCAGGKHGKDSCVGDSGGPLMYTVNDDGELRWVQGGIVSFGPQVCGSKGTPGVYTKLEAYMDWILINMKP